jgi:hypothetical protein
VVLHVARAHTYSFADGAMAFLFQQAQDLQSGRISYGLQGEDELLVG